MLFRLIQLEQLRAVSVPTAPSRLRVFLLRLLSLAAVVQCLILVQVTISLISLLLIMLRDLLHDFSAYAGTFNDARWRHGLVIVYLGSIVRDGDSAR